MTTRKARAVKRNRAFLKKLKKTLECKFCTTSHGLDFYYSEPSLKKSNVNVLVKDGYSVKRIQTEIEKCEVVCTNCFRRFVKKVFNKDRIGQVYFIKAGRHPEVKIGWAVDTDARLKSLQTGNAQKLVVLMVIKDVTQEFESYLHTKFTMDRMCGEWFYISNDILRFMSGQKESHTISLREFNLLKSSYGVGEQLTNLN